MKDEEVVDSQDDHFFDGDWPENDMDNAEAFSQERALENFDKLQYALEEQTVVVERTMNSACIHILDEQRALSQRAPRWADEVI